MNALSTNKRDGIKVTKTSKKVKVQGGVKYVNQVTGEVEDFQVIQMEDRDFNFHKLWLGHIVSSLDMIGNEKIKVLTYMMETANADNMIINTQRNIAHEVGVSIPTVNATIKALISSNLIRMVQQGVYILNPDVLFKGGHKNRMNVLLQYTTPTPTESSGSTEQTSGRKRGRPSKKKNSSEAATPNEPMKDQLEL